MGHLAKKKPTVVPKPDEVEGKSSYFKVVISLLKTLWFARLRCKARKVQHDSSHKEVQLNTQKKQDLTKWKRTCWHC